MVHSFTESAHVLVNEKSRKTETRECSVVRDTEQVQQVTIGLSLARRAPLVAMSEAGAEWLYAVEVLDVFGLEMGERVMAGS